MTAPTVSEFLAAFRAYLGVTERPLGSNNTLVGIKFGWNGVAWCAMTVSLACEDSGFGRLFWSASTDVWEANARNGVNGAKWIDKEATPRPGDLPIWDYKRDGTANHISVVESPRSDGFLVTMGGNESDTCQRAVRSKYALRGYIRLPFRVVVPVPPKPPVPKPPKPTPAPPQIFGEDDMFTLFYVEETKQYWSMTVWGVNKLTSAEGYTTDAKSSLTPVNVPTQAAWVKICQGAPRLY